MAKSALLLLPAAVFARAVKNTAAVEEYIVGAASAIDRLLALRQQNRINSTLHVIDVIIREGSDDYTFRPGLKQLETYAGVVWGDPVWQELVELRAANPVNVNPWYWCILDEYELILHLIINGVELQHTIEVKDVFTVPSNAVEVLKKLLWKQAPNKPIIIIRNEAASYLIEQITSLYVRQARRPINIGGIIRCPYPKRS